MAPETKRCSTCRTLRPLTDFNKRSTAPDGRQARCRACSAAWYAANKATHKANVRTRNDRVRAEHRRRLLDYLLEHPCVDCGEADVRVLEFDHEDPARKLAEVVRLSGFGVSWERVAAEIAKCSVRCANCHRRRTNDMFGFYRSAAEEQRRQDLKALAIGRLEALAGQIS